MNDQLVAALMEYQNRQARVTHPQGRRDGAGRFYLADCERLPCCAQVRGPSRAWPWPEMVHGRSLVHVAALFGVSASELRRAARNARPPVREGGETLYYKAAKRYGDGTIHSITDPDVVYVVGQTTEDKRPRQGHGGGLYCYDIPESARWFGAAKGGNVLLTVRGIGAYCRYGEYKLAFRALYVVDAAPLSVAR